MPRKKSAPSSEQQDAVRSKQMDPVPRAGVYGAAARLVTFLNTCPRELAEPEQHLQAAMRELCDFVLEAAGAPDESGRFGLWREPERPDPMNVLWKWYQDHPYVVSLVGWMGAASSRLTAVYRCTTSRDPRDADLLDAPREEWRVVKGEWLAADAAFSLWLLFLLADAKAYREGRGFVFHSTAGRRMRLLRCAVRGEFFIRSAGRTSEIQNACDDCQLPRQRGPRDVEFRKRKLRVRLKRLRKAWAKGPWDTRRTPVISWEPGPPDRGLVEVYADGSELVIAITGGVEREERKLAASAVRLLYAELGESGGA
jgi:hypothetical protein